MAKSMLVQSVEDSFYEEFASLLLLKESDHSPLIEYFGRYYEGEQKIDDKEMRKISEKLNISAAPVLRVFAFLLRWTTESDDTFVDILDDLQELKKISGLDDNKKAQLTKLFDELDKSRGKYLQQRLRKLSASRGAPVFARVEISPILKFQYAKHIKLSEVDINNYLPELAGLIPGALIELFAEAEETEYFSFQISQKNLEDLIKKLEMAKKDLELLREKSKSITA